MSERRQTQKNSLLEKIHMKKETQGNVEDF